MKTRNLEIMNQRFKVLETGREIWKMKMSPPNGKLSSQSGRFYFFLFQRKLHVLFSIPFLIFWNCINLAYEYHSLETRIWFLIIFLPLKESLTLFQIWFFCLSWIIMVGWASNHIFIKGVLDRTATFSEGCWERGSDFNQAGVANFT